MKKYKITRIFNDNGKTNLRYFYKKKGIYEIFYKDDLVYIGFSGVDLYTTILRHFEKWYDSEQPDRIFYSRDIDNYFVRVTVYNKKTRNRIHDIEKGLILKYKPRDNKTLYDIYSKDTDKAADEQVRAFIYNKDRVPIPTDTPEPPAYSDAENELFNNFIEEFKKNDFTINNGENYEKWLQETIRKQSDIIDNFLKINKIRKKGVKKYLTDQTDFFIVPF